MTTVPTQPHPDEAAFLTAIVANPHDDTARLVYADWLDEHGQADRAAEIRLEHPPWLGGRGRDATRWQSLAHRLLEPHVPASWRPWVVEYGAKPPTTWAEKVAGFHPTVAPVMCFIRHGFVAGIAMSERRFLDHSQTICAHQPITRAGIIGKRPSHWTVPSHRHAWMLRRNSDRATPESLPMELFRPLLLRDDGRRDMYARRDRISYLTRDAAYLALEFALMTYANKGKQQSTNSDRIAASSRVVGNHATPGRT